MNKPFGLRALTVVDSTGRRADMCGATLTFSEAVETKEVRENDVLLGTFSATTGFNFSFEEGAITPEAYAIMTGRQIYALTNGDGSGGKTIQFKSGDYYPEFTIIGKAISSDGRGDTHLRIVGAVLTGELGGEMAQDEFFVLSGSGVAREAELIFNNSPQPLNPSPLLGAAVVAYSALEEMDTYDNGEAVSSWQNLGLGQYALAQSVNASRPTYVQSAFASLPHISFDGADDSLTVGFGTGLIISRPLTIFLVASLNSGAGVRFILDSSGAIFSTAAKSRISVYFNSGTWAMNVGTQTINMGSVGIGTDTANTRVWAFVVGQSQVKRFRNGVIQNTSAINSININEEMAGLLLATSYVGGALMDMDVSELLIYNGEFSDDLVTALSAQLQAKWGL